MSKAVLFQTIQFSLTIFFVYSQLNFKKVLFHAIQINIRTEFKCQNSSFSNNSVHRF